jgi:hypothetical protein
MARHAAGFVLGGGLRDTDCTVAFGGVDATAGSSGLVCRDGDACDADTAVTGACRFDVSLCRAVTDDGCDPRSVSKVEVNGVSLDVPPTSGDAGVCGEPTMVSVPVASAVGITVLARDGDEPRDVDYLNLCCVDGTNPLDAVHCAVQVDLDLSACSRVPRKAIRAFTKARHLVDEAWRRNETPSRRVLRRVRAQLGHVQDVGRKLSDRDNCGNTLALIARHALDVVP